ncbi:EutP/PduV family microcompartment system protein [Microbacteriaceae bacterium 4G12]
MKKIILMGKTGCGKTTLCQKLHAQQIQYQKTQAVDYYSKVIDTPGEYMENRSYYKALIVTAVEADVIGLVQDCTEEGTYFPPSFGSSFPKPVIGIITKIDLAQSPEHVQRAREYLEMAGASAIFETSVWTGVGIKELEHYLAES